MSAHIFWTEEEDATPGPWKVHAGDDYICVLGPHDTTDAPLANVMWAADARLIAAAPELLAALKAATGRILNVQIGLRSGDTKEAACVALTDALNGISAAIAKVEPTS